MMHLLFPLLLLLQLNVEFGEEVEWEVRIEIEVVVGLLLEGAKET